MNQRSEFKRQAKALLVLGLPLIGSHLAQFAIGLTDTAMLGWYDVQVLAGQVLGGTLFFVLFMVGSGFAWAVMPLVAAAEGSQNHQQVRRVTRMGLWVSGLYAIFMMPIFLLAEPILLLLGQEPELAALAQRYLEIAGWAIAPALVVMVLKSYLAALEQTSVVFWVTVATAVINAVLNYALIFGHWGAPEWGILGAAVASVLSTLSAAIGLVIFVAYARPEHDLFRRFWRVDAEALGEVIRLGFPIGLTTLSEVGLFAAATLMMGWLGEIPLAAHGMALQVTSAVFMIHVGLSNAVTVRVGQAYGRGDQLMMRAVARTGLALAWMVALLTALIFLSVPELLLGLFMSPDEPNRQSVLQTGSYLLAAAALFQLVDACQIISLSVLRGAQDTKVPMVLTVISYWLVGVPVSYAIAFGLDMGGVGIWLGLAVGLALAGILLFARFWGWVIHQDIPVNNG